MMLAGKHMVGGEQPKCGGSCNENTERMFEKIQMVNLRHTRLGSTCKVSGITEIATKRSPKEELGATGNKYGKTDYNSKCKRSF